MGFLIINSIKKDASNPCIKKIEGFKPINRKKYVVNLNYFNNFNINIKG